MGVPTSIRQRPTRSRVDAAGHGDDDAAERRWLEEDRRHDCLGRRAAPCALPLTRTHCKRGHAYRRHGIWRATANQGYGTWVCLICRRANKRTRLRARAGLSSGLMLASVSFLSVRLKQAWVQRKKKWPQSGTPPASLARIASKRALAARQARWCRKQLHRWTAANTIRRANGKRTCRACVVLNRVRVRASADARRAVDRARAKMLAAHPDRGGSPEAFVVARAVYLRACDKFSR